MTAAEPLSTRIRSIRLKAGITQDTAARAAGVCVTSWRAWEWGTKQPRLIRGASIAQALNVPVAALFGNDFVLEVVVSLETIEEIRRVGREAARSAAERLASRLEPAIYEAATRKPVNIATGARSRPRQTRVEKLAGVEQANLMRKAAFERRRQPALTSV